MPRKRSLEISVGPVSVHHAVASLDEGVKREHSGKQQTQSRSANTLPKSLSGTIGQRFSLSGRRFTTFVGCHALEKNIQLSNNKRKKGNSVL